MPLDWRMVKAMVWTEVLAGPKYDSKEWTTRPMRIGVAGDPGFSVLKQAGTDKGENTELIITPELLNKLKQLQKWDGETNVKAGIAWLLRKACGDQVLTDENKVDDPQILTYRLDNKGFKGIAEKLQTTTDNIKINNPGIDFNKSDIGQEIKYQKAHREKYIDYWLDWRTAIKNYNSKAGSGSGDDEYTPKVERAYQIIISRDK